MCTDRKLTKQWLVIFSIPQKNDYSTYNELTCFIPSAFPFYMKSVRCDASVAIGKLYQRNNAFLESRKLRGLALGLDGFNQYIRDAYEALHLSCSTTSRRKRAASCNDPNLYINVIYVCHNFYYYNKANSN